MKLAATLILASQLTMAGLMAYSAAAAGDCDPSGFMLSSPEVADGGTLPVDFTGDGSAATLPLQWRGAPVGTASYAFVMHHTDREGVTKCYWLLYDIPANTTSLAKNAQGIGKLGVNSINGEAGYAPPHSKGPGPKTYVYTIYALSKPPQFDAPTHAVSRKVLLDAIKDIILASADLKVVYTRLATSPAPDQRRDEDQEQPPPQPSGRGDNATRVFQNNPTNTETSTRQ